MWNPENKWEFNVFQVSEASKQRPLTYVLYELLKKYGLLSTFKVRTLWVHGSPWNMFRRDVTHEKEIIGNMCFFHVQIPTNVLMSFADRVDQGYRKFRNPYHNPNHAADVAQTTHFFICQTGKFVFFFDLSKKSTHFARPIIFAAWVPFLCSNRTFEHREQRRRGL